MHDDSSLKVRREGPSMESTPARASRSRARETSVLAARSMAFVLAAGLASIFASGCVTGDLLSVRVDAAGRYDPQECVENALRSGPDPHALREAAVAFASACDGGEAASCSALGVMYELGRGLPMSTSRALSLYETACEAHNLRACGNRDRLVGRSSMAAADPALTVAIRR
jgi:TPR repeat protein